MNPQQKAAVERLAELSADPMFKLISPLASADLAELLSLIASLEEDAKILDWLNRNRLDYVRGTDFPVWRIEGVCAHRQMATDQNLRQVALAAMKGAV